MRKITIFTFLLFIVASLTGCVQEAVTKVSDGKEKVEYVAKAGSLLLETTNASLALSNLYQDPTRYGTAEWKEEFYANKKVIEDSHKELTGLTVPTNLQQEHDNFVTALEITKEANNTVATGIETGENLTAKVTEQLSGVLNTYKTLESTFTELSNLTQ